MITPLLVYNEVTSFIYVNMEFVPKYNQYRFQEKWAGEVDEEFFNKKIYSLKKSIISQLQSGLKNKEFLAEVMDMLWIRHNNLSIHNYRDIEYLDLVKPKIRNHTYDELQAPAPEKVKRDVFTTYSDGNSPEDENDSDYYYFLSSYSEKLNNYAEPIDFEKVKLIYCLVLFDKAVLKMYDYVYLLHEEIEYIDVSKLDVDEIEIESNYKKHVRCHSIFSKVDIAHLFYMLMEEDILYFEDDKRTKKMRQLRKFIEANISYQDRKGERKVPVEGINTEFSDVIASTKTKDHKLFLDKLISILENRKAALK